MPRPEAYYSNELKCWVRMTREHDNEWCHTSGYATREDALGLPPKTDWVHPCDVQKETPKDEV